MAVLGQKPRAITPVVFSTRAGVSLPDLLSTRSVRFDLDGFSEGRLWPWVKPETGILVWDPSGTGRITSGRQLFGSATWWMFWKNGYQPLAALDDNNNGLLTGKELSGIAVWRDKNSNGVSDPGEVVTVQEFGIVAIAVKPCADTGGQLLRTDGIQLKNGLTLPTFDWVPTSYPTPVYSTR